VRERRDRESTMTWREPARDRLDDHDSQQLRVCASPTAEQACPTDDRGCDRVEVDRGAS
jgi:hypothetical protein